jgi:hypothetical protein
MTKKQTPKPEILEEYVKVKDEFKEQWERKKQTQRDAKQRRNFVREMKEDRDYS